MKSTSRTSAVTIAAALLIAGAFATPAAASSKHKVTGTVIATALDDGSNLCANATSVNDCIDQNLAKYGSAKNVPGVPGKSCVAQEVTVGDQVVVKNENGKTIAVAELAGGKYNSASACVLNFTASVPDASFYSFGIAGHGTVTYPKSKLSRAHWKVRLTL